MASKCSSNSINTSEICSDVTNPFNGVMSKCTQKFSCWDQIDSVWLQGAYELKGNRIYVHREILEWVVEHINENILNENLRAEVEEVHHHNLDGPVYLIKFYTIGDTSSETLQRVLKSIKDQSKYKMVWKSTRTYFLRIDSHFKKIRMLILSRLQDLNVDDCFNVKILDVNWLFIPKIESYEIVANLSANLFSQIDDVFNSESNLRASLNICDQFEWHREVFYEVDELAIDICAEEWSRYDLLKSFTIQDVLRVDLANKDYRDLYLNEYLDRYLDRLLKKAIPQLYADDNGEKIEFPLYMLFTPYRHYFVSRFWQKISTLFSMDVVFGDGLTAYDLPIIDRISKKIDVDGDKPHPNTLLMEKCNTIEYKISNYAHFSDSLFRALLNQSNEFQKYSIRFDQGFKFTYDSAQHLSLRLTTDCIWSDNSKYIIIELKNCNENDTGKLADFVKYLINLFNPRTDFVVDVALLFKSCKLETFSFLENIGNSFDDISFAEMVISSSDIKLLSSWLKEIPRSVTFTDCCKLTDNNIMTLLETINVLDIEGRNACTPILYYLMAEYLITKDGVDTIKANQLRRGMIDCKSNFPHFDLDCIDFFRDGDKIVARNRHSKKYLDLYFVVNNINDDESFDPVNNMFME